MMEQQVTLAPEKLVRSGLRHLGWLAGYPRSGAALVRTILANCFGHYTCSIYREHILGDAYIHAVNLLPVDGVISLKDLESAAVKQGLLTFKTHELADDTSACIPTIVIVRDGRIALESLKAFYAERNDHQYTMESLIRGEHPWGSWSAWIRSWAMYGSATALWLRYEDIMDDVPGTVDRIARWTGYTPVSHEIPPFESMHASEPTIFRKCATSGNGEMTIEEDRMFWAIHGGTMEMLGYRRGTL